MYICDLPNQATIASPKSIVNWIA